jgi:hypothetical protein
MQEEFKTQAEIEEELVDLYRTHGQAIERSGKISRFSALYAQVFTSTREANDKMWRKILRECRDEPHGEARLQFYAQALYQRANEDLRIYTARLFAYEHVGVAPEIALDTQQDRFKAFKVRQELIPLCRALNVALDRSREVMPPVNYITYRLH